MKQSLFLEKLQNQLKSPLPGINAQYEMAPYHRPKIDLSENTEPYKKSAVMVLFHKKNDEYVFPLTLRQNYGGIHSGQISLPGGKMDNTDSNLMTTALRETEEEIGIANSKIKTIGELSPLYLSVSGYVIHPFIGVLDESDPIFKLEVKEVQQIIPFTVTQLLNPSTIKLTEFETYKGIKIKTPYFDVQGHIVWGATAMILNELKEVIKLI